VNRATKFTLTMTFGFLAIIVILTLVPSLFSGLEEQPEAAVTGTDSEAVADQLWGARGADMLVLAVMIFAGVIGVLALVPGGFKWQ
jgi:hypothetical protein